MQQNDKPPSDRLPPEKYPAGGSRMWDRAIKAGLIALIVIALLALISSLLNSSKPERAAFTCGPVLTESKAVADAAPDYAYASQVIVVGPAGGIGAVTDGLRADGLQLQLVRDCSGGRLSGALDKSLVDFHLQLYQISSNQGVAEAIRLINARGNDKGVFADANYRIARQDGGRSCSDPNETGGSPNETGGSPNETGGSPLAGIEPGAAKELFGQQWAFQHIGLDANLMRDPSQASALSQAGGGVLVGVFDTSPFTFNAAAHEQVLNATDVFTWAAPDWISPSLTLMVVPSTSSPSIAATFRAPLSGAAPVYSDVSEHGLFVSGLIHAVAPRSEIVLYEVLDDAGCGDLFGLITRMNEFIDMVDARRGELRGAVMNLSLGVIRPRITDTLNLTAPVDEVDEAQRAARQLLAADQKVESLQLTVYAAYLNDIAVVAAAGNNSWPNELQAQPLGPQLPAAYPFAISVAGSNANRQRSCFSNWGDISAPAGEGGPITITVTPAPGAQTAATTLKTISCAPMQYTCDGDCPFAVIGPVLTETAVFTSHYAYWTGTSFATPLVSGLAARVLDGEAAPATQSTGQATWSWMSPDNVRRAIACGAAASDGVINVPVTLARCMRIVSP